MKDTTTLYTQSCNLVDMIVDRWRSTQDAAPPKDGELSSLAYGALVRQIANDMRKMEMYNTNMQLVRTLAEGEDVGMDMIGGIPGDLSDLFDVFDEDEEQLEG